jgi:hypothetical protein
VSAPPAGPGGDAAAAQAPARAVTVLVHGTFAERLRWWRPGDGATTTFADRLEQALARRGVAGTVWKPALAAGFRCEDFGWSGRNRHEDRVAGGRRLAVQLNALAETVGATDDAPMVANLVGHSHGGNVILEALPRLSPSVRVGQVVLLGTPLLSYQPTLRIVRLVLALLLLFVVVSMAVFVLGTFIVPGVFDWMCALLGFCAQHTKVGAGWLLLLAAAMVLAYGWVFLVLAWLVDVAWRVLLFPLTALSRKHPGQVYGPRPDVLARLLGGRRAVLFTSHQDEADLILELSMAPRRVYAEWVAAKWGAEVKVLERVALRPVVVGLLLRILEIILERYMLGFSWPRVLIFDHEMADLDRGKEYPATVLERVDVSNALREALYRQPASVPVWWPLPVPGAERLGGDARRVLTLKETLRMMVRDVLAQVKPRHSEYYESDAVLERVADVVAGLD